MSSSNIERRPDEADRSQGRGPDAPGVDSPLVDVRMPQMGVSVAEGTIVAWHKRLQRQNAVALVPIIGHFECREACMARVRVQPAQLRP